MAIARGFAATAIFAGLLSSVATARADSGAVALAVGQYNGSQSTVSDGSGNTAGEASQDALSICTNDPGTTGCKPAGAVTSGCIAVALGFYPRYETGMGPTIPAAEAAARTNLIQDGTSATAGNPTLNAICVTGQKDGF